MKSKHVEETFTICENADGVTFNVHVQPRASRNELCGVSGNEIKLRLTSPPVDGAANKLCVEYLAHLLDVAKSRVTIIRGEKSRHKTIKVDSIKKNDVLALLDKR